MTKNVFGQLREQLEDLHKTSRDVANFATFPQDLRVLEHAPRYMPVADHLEKEVWQDEGAPWDALRDAFIKAAPQAFWRDTYAHTIIKDDFINRFGCYAFIGAGGPYISAHMSAYMVYMPPKLHYPWHHHPAEEMYLVLAGEAKFHKKNAASKVLRAGDTSIHASNQPHAMETFGRGVMAYVLWRGDLTTKPIWTDAALRGDKTAKV